MPVGGSSLVIRIERHMPLTTDERLALADLEARDVHFARRKCLCREGERSSRFYVLKHGLVASSMNLASGRRQITRLHFPGDLLGLPGIGLDETVSTLTPLTDVTASWFDKATLGRLFADHPRIGALFFMIAQHERVKLIDRVVSLGQTSARSRIAAVLIQIQDRLRTSNPAIGTTIPLPLNQTELGDMTGLTSVHVNRTLRAMVANGLINKQPGHVTILDEEALVACAELPRRSLSKDFSWLPPPREDAAHRMTPFPIPSPRNSPGGPQNSSSDDPASGRDIGPRQARDR